jgi:flavin-dependent thymidylate synthase
MNVTLIDGTGFGSSDPGRYAANMIAYTRSTRLNMSPGLLAEIQAKEDYEVLKELQLAAGTIPSSWEFVQFTFIVEKVTRAFTHQLVRTRHASYAQQAMRIVEMKDFEYATGPTLTGQYKGMYDDIMKDIAETYEFLIDTAEVAPEDARGILPTNILTNICMHINMRNFINLTRKRVSKRVQDEYRSVLDAMIMEVEKVYPWFYLFYKNDGFKARIDLQNMIYENKNLSSEEKVDMVKKLDIIGGQEL